MYNIEANNTRNSQSDQSDIESNHQWPSGMCVVVGDSIVSGVDERLIKKESIGQSTQFQRYHN